MISLIMLRHVNKDFESRSRTGTNEVGRYPSQRAIRMACRICVHARRYPMLMGQCGSTIRTRV